MELRKEVRLFAEAMERKLQEKENLHPGGWKNASYVDLFFRAVEELGEVAALVERHSTLKLLSQSVDVANMLMMLCDVSDSLEEKKALAETESPIMNCEFCFTDYPSDQSFICKHCNGVFCSDDHLVNHEDECTEMPNDDNQEEEHAPES